jgi:hypothetical protein
MKYCEICNCNVSQIHSNCPLCGSYLTQEGKGNERYKQVLEPAVKYPNYVLREKVDYLRTKNNLLLMLVALVCIALNILLTPQSVWSVYVVIGIVGLIALILMPIANRSKLYRQIMLDLPVLTILTIATELTINRLGGLEISIQYLLPSIYSAAIILIDSMIIATSKKRTTGYFSALLIATIFAIVPQILIWSFLGKLGYSSVFPFVVFFFAIVNIGVIAITCLKRLREEYGKKMNF